MTKSLNQIIFFPPPKSEYFFQQHWESEYFFRKKKHNPSLEVKWSLIESVVKHHKTKSNKPYLKVNTTTDAYM